MQLALAALLLAFPQAQAQPATSSETAPPAVTQAADADSKVPSFADEADPLHRNENGRSRKEERDSSPPGHGELHAIELPVNTAGNFNGIESDPRALPGPPPHPAFMRPYETQRQRRMWYALVVAGHSAATFDAWTTRRALSSGQGHELNPLLKPFARSGMLYVAVQASPALMDYLGRRMMRSRHGWVRRMWWLPQSAETALSIASGIHNYGLVK